MRGSSGQRREDDDDDDEQRPASWGGEATASVVNCNNKMERKDANTETSCRSIWARKSKAKKTRLLARSLRGAGGPLPVP